MERVLITGAAGTIGRALREGLRGAYPVLRLSDIAPLGEAGPGEEVQQADLRELDQIEAIMAGVDAVVHLGGMSVENTWELVHEANIVGCYHVFEAARRQGVKRVVFASSNHAIGFHRRSARIDFGHNSLDDRVLRMRSKPCGERIFFELLDAQRDTFAL